MKLHWITLSLLCVATASAQMQMDSGPGRKFMDAMNDGMKKMDHDMAAAPMNGNPDHDFVTMMIPHHQGAIDMARVELQYGKDPAMRQLAERIIKAQKVEIAEMNDFLKK
jgi:uncharacterized protein (DUF305 family)